MKKEDRFRLGGGWLRVYPSTVDPGILEVLHLHVPPQHIQEIYVPIPLWNKDGELHAQVFRTSEDITIARGLLLPCDRGVRMVDPTEHRRSRLKTLLIHQLRNEMVELHFIWEIRQ